jgi:5,10-methylenetetrahydromethanopterin reductase
MTGLPRFAVNRLDMRSPAAFAASAQHAERLGFGAACVPSSPLLVQDPYVLLSHALAATSSLRLGPLIENPVTRHPAVIAGSIATLERLAPGRTWLGLGAGDTAVRLLGLAPARIAELEAATTLVRRLLAREDIEVGARAPARLRHAAAVPVWIAAQGPRTLRMAGRVADGVFLRAGCSPLVLAHAVEQVRAGAREAGRDVSEVRFSLVLHTVLDDDAARTDVIARAIAAGYYEYSPALFALAGVGWAGPDVHALQKLVWPDFHHAADLHAAGGHVAFLGQDAMDAFALHGDGARVRAQLRGLLAVAASLGVAFEMIVLHPVPVWPGPQDVNAVLERFAAEVVSPLQSGPELSGPEHAGSEQ